MRIILFLAIALSSLPGCGGNDAPASADHLSGTVGNVAAALADDRDCNLSTPLQPGIPGSPGHLIPSERNPNGDSELSALMRKMVDDLREARVLLEAGKPVQPLNPTHRRIRCSWPTRPADRNPTFDALAQGYLAQVRAYDAAPGQETYNNVIRGCISCHAASCGGPLDFIDGMLWQ